MIKDCKMRHENGNCLPAGGFCTANTNICEALQNAYNHGYFEGCQIGFEKGKELQWIPVSEGLPKYYEPVLTWDGGAFVIEQRIPYICGVNGERIQGDWWVSADYDEIETDYYPGLRDGAAIAWMPLPEPYEGEC